MKALQLKHSRRATAILIVVTSVMVFGCKNEGPPAPAPSEATAVDNPAKAAPHGGLDVNNPESCRPCHATVVEEFMTSMHAQSHHGADPISKSRRTAAPASPWNRARPGAASEPSAKPRGSTAEPKTTPGSTSASQSFGPQLSDPIYAGVRRVRMKREGPEVAKACATCHTPNTLERGLTCATCHMIAQVKPGLDGNKAFTPTQGGLMLGPHDLKGPKPAPHGVGAAPPHMKDGTTLCLACHGDLHNGNKLALCDTGGEFRQGASLATGASKGGTCVSCHMTRVAGPAGAASNHRSDHASHRFHGPHALWSKSPQERRGHQAFLEQHLELAAAFDGDEVVTTLKNHLGHSYPSGFPGRVAMVKAVGRDASGAVVWSSPGPPKPTVEAAHVLKKVYVDAEGAPTLAPYGVKIAIDSRLGPGKTRSLRWKVPTSVTDVEVSLVVRLLPPPLAKKLGLESAVQAEPRIALKVALKRPPTANPQGNE